MFTKNQLVHAVIWPVTNEAAMELIDTDGVVQSNVPIQQPQKGDEVSRMIPEGFEVDVMDCYVVDLSGEIIKGSKAEFDTAVVTERAEIGFEERMARLERKEKRREKREARREQELIEAQRELKELRKAKKAKKDAEPKDPPEDPQDPPQDPPADNQDPPKDTPTEGGDA